MHFFKTDCVKRGSDRVLLFVHGYTGGPGAFLPFKDYLPFDYCSLLLPGHGEEYAAFSDCSFEAWFEAVKVQITELKKSYNKVYLAGYSLGSVLSLLCSKEVEALFLFAPAVVKAETRKIDTKSKVELKDVNPSLLALCDEEDKKILSLFLSMDTARGDRELERAREALLKDTSKLDVPCFAYVGKKDPVVPYEKALPYLEKRGIAVRLFPSSTHAILYGEGFEEVRESFLQDIKEGLL